MTEKQCREYLEYLNTLGRVPGLSNIKHLCERLENPQDQLAFIHITGTNGKGSVGAYLASALEVAGLKVGRYISPTICDWRERIMIGRRMISKRDLLQGMELMKQTCEEMVTQGLSQPTSFEVETALGFWYFQKKGCDIVILECGMGGLLDATNIVKTTLAEVFTPIGMDHEAFLGNTLAKIASQKAGIVKKGSIAVSAMQEPEALAVLEQACKKEQVPLFVCDPAELDRVKYGLKKQSFRLSGKHKLTISLAGICQIENAHLAAKTLLMLTGCDRADEADQADRADCPGQPGAASLALAKLRKKVDLGAIQKGLLQTEWPARFQVLQGKPVLVIDGAHNRPAAKMLAESLKFYFPNQRIVFIMGVFQDKDAKGILEETANLAKQIITIRLPDAARSMDALALAELARAFNPNVTSADSVEEALEMADLLAGKEGIVVAFGSLSYLGRVLKLRGAETRKKR
ncbi:MAG: bifunctional folylpolyglutamate synthase/dihydrofolate synthase [Lachnospiraceae bacterium]|nr:bifunctional folylpolyglutamate synthase/dihydrofolate synthase [Lachnospiraceae bacterium]